MTHDCDICLCAWGQILLLHLSNCLLVRGFFFKKKGSQKAGAEKSLENLNLYKPASAFHKFDFHMDGIEKNKSKPSFQNCFYKSYALKGERFDVIAHIIQECRLDW